MGFCKGILEKEELFQSGRMTPHDDLSTSFLC